MTETTDATLTSAEGLHTLRTNAGWAPLDSTGWIAVTGEDRVRWLNGMVTNSVQALTPGEGAYTFLLNAQGRIQGDATVWCEADRLLLQTDRAQIEPMLALLDRFIIMDDVELQDLTDRCYGIAVGGPQAPGVLQACGIPARASRLLKRTFITWQDHSLQLLTAHGPVVPRFQIWSESATTLAALQASLPVPQADNSAMELLRVLEGVPRFGTDIRDRDLPQETAQTRALHFNKGCYLGQEIVERIRSRGQVHRTFAQFVLHGDAPAAGAELTAEGKAAGILTTVASEPVDGNRLALGYVRREAIERKLTLTYPGGTAAVRVEAPAPNAASNA